jgi:hypothetical protein
MKQYFIVLLLTAVTLVAQNSTVTSEEASQGWVSLFDGQSLSGWTPQGSAQWKVVDGAIVADEGDYGWLRYDKPYSDFDLKLEFRTAADGNSGVFVRSNAEGAPHLTGYEVQIFDKHEKFPTGSIVGHVAAKTPGAIKPGEWQTMEIRAVGQRIMVKLDGNTLLDTRDGKSKAGYIGLQYNRGKKIEFRNVRIRPVAR